MNEGMVSVFVLDVLLLQVNTFRTQIVVLHVMEVSISFHFKVVIKHLQYITVPSMPQATQNHGSFMAMPQPYATSNASFMGGNGLVSMPSYHMRPMQPLSTDIAYAAPSTHYPIATPANRNTYPHPSIPPIPLPQMFMDRVDLLQ
eukprot:246402_1